MYGKSVKYYDAVYQAMGKDYEAEASDLHELISKYKRSPGNALLDVACGTGLHLSHLSRHYTVEGIDLNRDMLAVARKRCPDVVFHFGDMMDFDLGKTYDVVTCLFSAIGHAKTREDLGRAISAMSRHVAPGGVLLVEPWLHPEVWKSDRPWMDTVDVPDLKLVRMNVSKRRGHLAILDFHFLVATPDGVEHFTESHELGLYTHDEYLGAFAAAALEPNHEPGGPMNRGRYIGLKAVAS